MRHQKMHSKFSLNGNKFDSVPELLAYSKALSLSIYSFLSSWFDDDTTITIQTSGSTGKPKSIQLHKEHMYNSAVATGSYFNLEAETLALLCLPTDYIAGKMMLVRGLVLGWQVDFIEPNAYPLSNIDKTYDFCAMVPLQLYNSLDKINLIKKLIIGGGVVSNQLLQKIVTIPTEIFATYGMTETCTHIAVKRLNQIEHFISSENEKSPNYFNVLPNIKISIDPRGCLVIDAPSISEGNITTNDLVEIASATQFKWLGRFDNIINSGGVKLIPELIEHKLASSIDARFFVAGVADPVLGEKLILVVESEEMNTETSEKIRNLTTLNKYEIPKQIYFLKAFVETETKKIHREHTLAKILL